MSLNKSGEKCIDGWTPRYLYTFITLILSLILVAKLRIGLILAMRQTNQVSSDNGDSHVFRFSVADGKVTNPVLACLVMSPLHAPCLERRMKNILQLTPAKVTSAVMYQHRSFRLYFFVPFLLRCLMRAGAVKSFLPKPYLVFPFSPTLMHPR